MFNKCEHCEYAIDTFGNFLECVKLHRFIDYWYWNNISVEDCPLEIKDNQKAEEK